jgi:hypothetical protein
MKYLLLLLITFNAFSQEVVTVKKGDVVPFDGVLFTKERELQIRKEVLEKDFLVKKNLLLEELGKLQQTEIDIANKRVDVYQKRTQEMADREVRQENTDFWKSAFYFTAGALIVGIIGYGVVSTYE